VWKTESMLIVNISRHCSKVISRKGCIG
jgi:hypothetical protein